jgi:hypothetical protein
MLKRVLYGMWMGEISPETRVHGRLQTDSDQRSANIDREMELF